MQDGATDWTLDPTIDCCPMTGERDCARCSGEYCDIHFAEPCDCPVCERHGLGDEMNEEHCCVCDDPTGKAGQGDDSLFCESCEDGPFCSECWNRHQCAGHSPIIDDPE